jgi:hypothetical protein
MGKGWARMGTFCRHGHLVLDWELRALKGT